MLDVHPPEHRLGGPRDFFLHLFTITVGLLIALGLENTVEALHHHHQREQADAEIREEIHANLDSLALDQGYLQAEMQQIAAAMTYVEVRLSGKSADSSTLKLQLQETPLKDAAWRTASTTGVAQFMDYSTVERFSECYKEQASLEDLQKQVLTHYLAVEGFVAMKPVAQLSDAELREGLPDLRLTLASLGGARDIGRGMKQSCEAALAH